MRRFLPLLLVAGCTASHKGYPSLAPRPIEQQALFEEPERATPAATRDPALDAKVAEVVARLDAAERDFAEALAALRRTGSAPAVGSEAWIAAQLALTRLDAARGPASQALADLDALRLAAAQAATPPDTAALDAARSRAEALEAAQRAAYQAEAARLPAA
ncbi:hypothetical protein [Sphingomonas jatrophae]|uniref:Uncharacterized protein n=1 Tax=Sphingomonas jatrophae TaxID=1166337 RepID=A0A1I6L9N6_9SPHN|nr:hypothetical protein [Sphingomonas jatrophae]SFS00104.1 hypothetical protein SAMN05192580_2475 [Sphingomonas jatrophae]